MKYVELLAPAGNYETMVGAFNAGADAVYLGGQGFGARAFADNFTDEEVVRAIRYAHLHDKKIYLTTNTLLKEKEISDFKEFFKPFAYAGLDAAIIQDLGIFKIIREEFPWVELHASTQMTLTGPEGAKLLKEMGASRIVPARELSLKEINGIHRYCEAIDGKGIEIEAFIHGAMCYCYSGACLFSSMVGERSGNRGRCAQPCRLPYKLNGHDKECYPLSLRDMCMADRVPELIEAGIDSFKIEGRMKKPEYAAGVTSIYRKFIDRYYEEIEKDSSNRGKIQLKSDSEDRKILSSLYLRSEIGEGYYFRHNSPEMVTLQNPSYNGSDDAVLQSIRDKYLGDENTAKIPVNIDCFLHAGEKARLEITLCSEPEEVKVTVYGEEVQPALKRPMLSEDCEKQLKKLGNTEFSLEKLNVDLSDAPIFISNKELNELRRSACEQLGEEILKSRGYESHTEENTVKDSSDDGAINAGNDKNKSAQGSYEIDSSEKVTDKRFTVSVMTKKQLDEVLAHNEKTSLIDCIYIDGRIILTEEELNLPQNISFYVMLPFISRFEDGIPDHFDLKTILDKAEALSMDGVIVRGMEQLSYCIGCGYKGDIIPDYGLYIWNHESYNMVSEILKGYGIDRFNLPLELSARESEELLSGIYSEIAGESKGQNVGIPAANIQVYGRVPMMITANCIRNTFKNCTKKRASMCDYETIYINDRTGRILPVTYDCRYCCNVIWNSVPVSLFKKADRISRMMSKYKLGIRLDFTVEKPGQCEEILSAYEGLFFENRKGSAKQCESTLAAMEYTTGHFERSAD